MPEHLKAQKITDSVYWVGAIDWSIRNFHGYSTSRGTSYNAYLILADKITLVDTVKASFKDELIARISSVVNPSDISYIISNHAEMDHSGCLVDLINLTQPEKVFASQLGAKTLKEHFHDLNHEIISVKDGEKINLGNREVSFIETRMLHWPDSMATYLADDGILFSNDVFGMHLASYERFDDEINESILQYEAAKYYANIILPFSSFVTKLMPKLDGLNLNLKYVATDHGPVWRSKIPLIFENYKKWPLQTPVRKAVVFYDTMWGSTAKMADHIGYGLSESGIVTQIMPISVSHRSDIATELLEAGAFVVGSPVLNTNLYPTVADTLTYIKGLKPQNLLVGAFGSYGWSDSVLDQLKHILVEDMKQEFVGDIVKSKYVPFNDTLKNCYDYGSLIAQKLKEIS